MRRFILLTVLICPLLIVCKSPVSENYTRPQLIHLQVEGLVKDANDNSPISNAGVKLYANFLDPTGWFYTRHNYEHSGTDESGYYFLEANVVVRGDYPPIWIYAVKYGYQRSKEVSVRNTENLQKIDFYLEPSAN